MTIYFNSKSEEPWNKLSNFYMRTIIYKGLSFASAEHAYHWEKTTIPDEQKAIRAASTAYLALQAGRAAKLRPEWNENFKLAVTFNVLRCKFQQHTDLKQLLLSTGKDELIHKAPWDEFWGDGKHGTGRNLLGKLMMDLREFYREEIKTRTVEKSNGR